MDTEKKEPAKKIIRITKKVKSPSITEKESSNNMVNEQVLEQEEIIRSPIRPEDIVQVSLKALKRKKPAELQAEAEKLGIENVNSMIKQELIFAILKKTVEKGGEIYGEGVLEILTDGFGFCNAFASTPPVKTLPEEGRTVL